MPLRLTWSFIKLASQWLSFLQDNAGSIVDASCGGPPQDTCSCCSSFQSVLSLSLVVDESSDHSVKAASTRTHSCLISPTTTQRVSSLLCRGQSNHHANLVNRYSYRHSEGSTIVFRTDDLERKKNCFYANMRHMSPLVIKWTYCGILYWTKVFTILEVY